MALVSKRFSKDSSSNWEEVWPGITRKILGYDDRLMLVKVRFVQGTVAPAHDHPHSQCSYIESGIFEVKIGSEIKILGPGDGFNVPSGITHSVIAREAGIIIDAFSPHREDFLE
jgi:quercetin dioxygenase-like cupin family protein